jgi:hypothetical protein
MPRFGGVTENDPQSFESRILKSPFIKILTKIKISCCSAKFFLASHIVFHAKTMQCVVLFFREIGWGRSPSVLDQVLFVKFLTLSYFRVSFAFPYFAKKVSGCR